MSRELPGSAAPVPAPDLAHPPLEKTDPYQACRIVGRTSAKPRVPAQFQSSV